MTKIIKKPLSVLLAALMIVSLFAVVPISASAETKPWTDNITTGGEYTCPSALSRNTIVSGGTEENPVIINITGQTTVQAPIFLRSGYLKIVGNNNSVVANRGFVSFSETVSSSCRPNGNAHLTVTDLSFLSTNATNQYIQITSQNYKCQSSLENVTFKNCNVNGSGAVVIGSETTHTLKNCTFEDNTGYNAGGISFRYGSDVTMEGCTFKNCTRTRPYNTSFLGGGAVWLERDTKLTLDGCTFENCTGECGAVGIVSTATLTLKGNTTITGNSSGNLYLPTGATVKIDEDFNGTVGVTTETAPTDSASVLLASDLADTQAALANKNILSDNENYGVIYKDNSLLLINSKVYTVTWKNDDGTIIDTTTVANGTTPTHTAPAKAEDENYTYTFSGWTPEVVAATADATYTATFTAVPKYDYITTGGNGYNFSDPFEVGIDDTLADKNNYTSLCNFKLLGVQKKVESDELDSESKTDVRFVSVVKTDILRDADEYGYIFAKADNKEQARDNVDKIVSSNAKVLTVPCKKESSNLITSNTVSGAYGDYNAETSYKYVTATVNGIGDSTVAARFYVKKGDNYYYADYTNKDNETYTVCATAFSDLG